MSFFQVHQTIMACRWPNSPTHQEPEGISVRKRGITEQTYSLESGNNDGSRPGARLIPSSRSRGTARPAFPLGVAL